MKLKAKYKSLEDIPKGYEALYSENEDGVFTLIKIEGLVEADRLDEFRDNNRSLSTQIEEANTARVNAEKELKDFNATVKSTYGNIDLDAYNTLMANKKALEEKELIEAGKHEELLARREDELRNEFSNSSKRSKEEWGTKEKSFTDTISNLNGQLSTLLVDNQISAYATAMGVLPTALNDVLARGRNVWTVVEGIATAKGRDGRQLYAEDATTPLSMPNWIANLAEEAPHLFANSNGSGEHIENVDDLNLQKDKSKGEKTPTQNILEGLESL